MLTITDLKPRQVYYFENRGLIRVIMILKVNKKTFRYRWLEDGMLDSSGEHTVRFNVFAWDRWKQDEGYWQREKARKALGI